ncbi:S8 family peptidase [Geopsychrobacter electrodiphilus]|uniref:S8 family peptidase n=1 Tax=Geopsychrobacter electrodiphilus TaxID=225196 RepID=UPI00037E0A59|nr:S8 family peptidase [Geopsychrobacter electrodiphilus]
MSVSFKMVFVGLGFIALLFLASCGDSTPTRALVSQPGGGAPASETYSLSGTITPAATSAVDVDTNDPKSRAVSNDDPANAQTLSNPVTLGGYATAVPTGVSGDRFSAVADLQDWYRVTLTAGQTVTLTISDHDGNSANLANPDFDLFLVNPTTLLDAQTSEGLTRQEVIKVLTSGDYYLQVYAFNAGSNYTLSIGQAPFTTLSRSLHIEDEFVPNQVIVRLKKPAPGITPQAVTSQLSSLGLEPLAGRPGESQLYRLSGSANAVRAQSATGTGTLSKGTGTALQQAKRATLDQVKSLRRRADVASADLNYIRRPLLVPNDPSYAVQWQAGLINLPQAWDLSTGSPSVVVAVLDTGVLSAHPDLIGRLCTATDNCAGYDFVSDPLSGADGDGIDPNPEDPGDHSLPGGTSSFHGTHVAGILGAAGNNALGVAGVDWAAKIMPVRVLGVNYGTSYDIIQGVRYAAGLSNDANSFPVTAANVLNLSFGGGGFSQAEQDLYTQLHDAGIIVVAAAGNAAKNLPVYPAAYADVVAVSAVDIDKNLAPYSDYGAFIDVAAPGGNLTTDRNGDGVPDGIISTSGNDSTTPLTYTYVPYMGTSMAAPQVAGVAALMLAVDPTLTPAEFDLLLAAGALTQDLGADGAAVRNDSFGYGLIDAQKALLATLALAGGGSLPPSLALSPSLLNFGANASKLLLTLSNAGGGTLNITGVSFTAPWISSVVLGTEAPPGSGLGDYTVTVDRTGLSDGVYSDAVTFTTDTPGSFSVSLLLQVGASGVADAGRQTVYLVDPATGNRLKTLSVSADPVSGTYHYSFTGLSTGKYYVTASSDLDNDGQNCDSGEACGSYPLLTDPVQISLDTQSLTGIDFSTGFNSY